MKRYQIILADPPWSYGDKRIGRGGAEGYYTTARAQDLRALPIERLADHDCVLFLWATAPQMPQAIALVRAWGFEFKTFAFTWVKRGDSGKLAWGTGSWTRANAEHCLLATRGKPARVSAGVHSVIEAPRGEHSAKPATVRDRIVELCGDVPRIELFARQAAPGWSRWGFEAPAGEGHVAL